MPRLPRFPLPELREESARFGDAFPAIAGSLGEEATDPWTERLVEGVQYLAATVIDRAEAFRERAHDLLAERASPWLRRPVPSATVLAFDPAPTSELLLPQPTTFSVERRSLGELIFTPQGPLRLVPCTVTDAALEAGRGRLPSVKIVLTASGETTLETLLSDGIDLYIDGDLDGALHLVHAFTTAREVVLASPDWAQPVAARATRIGLSRECTLAPDPGGQAPGFGVVADAWLFPHKFRFVRISADPARLAAVARTRTITVAISLSEGLPAAVRIDRDRVRTNAAVVTNVFDATAEPLPFDPLRGAQPVRVSGQTSGPSGVYAVTEARVVSARGRVSLLPDARRLGAPSGSTHYPGIFAIELEQGPNSRVETMVTFGAREATASADDGMTVVSMSLRATNEGLADSLRPGEFTGAIDGPLRPIRFRNVVAASRYIRPPLGDSLALRAVRWAAVGRGPSAALDGLKAALHRMVPSWMGSDDSTKAYQQRIAALRSLEVRVARRASPDGSVRRGYGYRIVVDETPFRGPGELALFGATLREAFARHAPIGTFVELEMAGQKTPFAATFLPEEGASA